MPDLPPARRASTAIPRGEIWIVQEPVERFFRTLDGRIATVTLEPAKLLGRIVNVAP